MKEQKPKKKSLIGWTHKRWKVGLHFRFANQFCVYKTITTPQIENKKTHSSDKKVRITIEEIK